MILNNNTQTNIYNNNNYKIINIISTILKVNFNFHTGTVTSTTSSCTAIAFILHLINSYYYYYYQLDLIKRVPT